MKIVFYKLKKIRKYLFVYPTKNIVQDPDPALFLDALKLTNKIKLKLLRKDFVQTLTQNINIITVY